jgi:hypothetical protein
LNAETLKQLQTKLKISPRNLQNKRKLASSRRIGTISTKNDLDATIGAMEEILGLNGKNQGTESEEKNLAAKINTIAVLDMIRNLQDQIKVSAFKENFK